MSSRLFVSSLLFTLFLQLYPTAVACHGLPDEEKVKILDGTRNCTIGQVWLVDHVKYECRKDDRDGEYGTRAFPKHCYDNGVRPVLPGSTWENLQFRFKCVKASQDIMFFYITHCKTPKGQVVTVGSSVSEANRTLLCLRLEDTVKLVTEKGRFCQRKGETIAVDQEWFEGQVQYKCVDDGADFTVIAIGCKTESGIVAKNGEIVSNGDEYVKCNAKATPIWRTIACVDAQNNQEMLPGRSWRDANFVYKCLRLNSNLFHPEITHCISPSGFQIAVNQRKQENEKLWYCTRSATDNKVTLTEDRRKSCASATGEVYTVDETWNDGHIVYRCVANSLGESIIDKECLDENGTSVSPGKIVTVATDLYKCDPDHPEIWLQVACIDATGGEILPGTTWRSDEFVHLCAHQSDGTYSSVITHCITPSGNSLTLNGRTFENGNTLKCVSGGLGVKLTNESGSFCIHAGRLHDLGTTWIDGYVQYNCILDVNSIATVNKTGCRASSGQSVSVGSVLNILGSYYKCSPNSNEIWTPVACVNDKGIEVLPGHSWKTPDFVYECIASGLNTFVPTVTHCITDMGSTVIVGGKINEKGKLLACERRNDGTVALSVSQDGFCAFGDYFYSFGQEWFDGYVQRKCELENGVRAAVVIGCKGANEIAVPTGSVININGENRKCDPADKNVWVKIACVSDTQKEILPGQLWKNDEFIYKCVQSDHDLLHYSVPTHCISQSGIEIPADTRVDYNGSLLMCQSQDGQLALVDSQAKFCKWKGEIYDEETTWYSGVVQYKCHENEDGQMIAAAIGCRSNDGFEANEGELRKIGSQYYKCSPADTADVWVPVACVSRDLQAVDAGKSYQEGKNILRCVPDGLGKYKSVITHCITSSGTPILAGNKFEENSNSYHCAKNGSLFTEGGKAPVARTTCPAGFKSAMTCSKDDGCQKGSYCRQDPNRLGTCCSSIKSATFTQVKEAPCKVNIRFRGCLYSSLSAGIFPFANNFNPLQLYSFLLTNRLNGRLASPDDNLRQMCASYANFKFCTSGVNVAECPVTQLYSSWFSLAFDVCRSSERQNQLLSALNCLQPNVLAGRMSICAESTQNLLASLSADDLTDLADSTQFCADVGGLLKCLRPTTADRCGSDGPTIFAYAENHLGDMLAGMWGSECHAKFNEHLVEDNTDEETTGTTAAFN